MFDMMNDLEEIVQENGWKTISVQRKGSGHKEFTVFKVFLPPATKFANWFPWKITFKI